MRRYRVSPALLLWLVLASGAWAASAMLSVAEFSALRPGQPLPAAWTPLTAENISVRTRYTLVDDGGTTVLRAESSAGASGLSRRLRVDPAEFAWLRWRWKISNIIAQADLRTKAGDDFPVRLYVMFDYPLEKLPFFERNKLRLARALFDPNLPAATLCYVWDGSAPVETVTPSAYTERVKLIVVTSGAGDAGKWVGVERNIARDFRMAFGDDAPPVTAIALMTDTDNTGTTVTAHFGDILFNKHQLGSSSPVGGATP